MANYLIARLSAIGDVAMTLPVVYAVARANPEHKFTLLTQPFLTTIIIDPPNNLEAMAIDIKREERRIWGLLRYAKRLREEGFDAFVDLHDVLRTKVLRFSVGMFSPCRVWSIAKPRQGRKKLIAHDEHKDLTPLPSMLSLYQEVLASAGLRVPESIPPLELRSPRLLSALSHFPELTKPNSYIHRVGIAPFASTASKTYQIDLMEQVVSALSARSDCRVYLFGARGEEARVLDDWATKYSGVESLAGKLELADELAVMSRLSCMLSMDSANAHLASFVGTRVISIWCATHPSAGFMPLGQKVEDSLQPEGLSCRPCTIFGKMKKCVLGDMPCRRGVPVQRIVEHIVGI